MTEERRKALEEVLTICEWRKHGGTVDDLIHDIRELLREE